MGAALLSRTMDYARDLMFRHIQDHEVSDLIPEVVDHTRDECISAVADELRVYVGDWRKTGDFSPNFAAAEAFANMSFDWHLYIDTRGYVRPTPSYTPAMHKLAITQQ